MTESPLVVGVGTVAMDLVTGVPRLPEPDGRVELLRVSIQGGGPVPTALVTARALGCRARLAGRVAGDDFGRFLMRDLRDTGIDCDQMRVAATGQLSPFSFIAVAGPGDRRVTYTTAGDLMPLGADDIDLNTLLDGARLLVVDGEHPAAQIAAAEEARERGIPVLVNAAALREGTGELLSLCDVLVASERLVSEVAPRGEAEDSLVELQVMGPRTVVITLGAAGSVGLSGDKLVRQPAHPVDVIDTVGAGDVFAGALAVAIARDLPLERGMDFAAAAAALSCRAVGARAGVAELDEVLAFLGWGALS